MVACLSPSIYVSILASHVLTFLDIDSFSSYKETSLPRMTINGHSGNKEERCIRVKSDESGSKQIKRETRETRLINIRFINVSNQFLFKS